MNDTVKQFLQNNVSSMEYIESDFFKVKSDADINPILNRYYIPSKRIKKYVSIADILGYDYECIGLSRNLVSNLSNFFDENGTTYKTRSVGMLKMDREKCVKTLKAVSENDTIYVRECEDNKYVITDNGMHRYHVLRFHYLNELSQIDQTNSEQVKNLKLKYTIPVEVQQTDYVKTYSYFILKKLIPNISLSADYDSNYNLTGNVVIKIGDKQKVFSDEELIAFLQSAVVRHLVLVLFLKFSRQLPLQGFQFHF